MEPVAAEILQPPASANCRQGPGAEFLESRVLLSGVKPYLQNPTPDAMTVIWFTEANASGTLTVNLPEGGTQVFSSTPEFKSELAYHADEAATGRTNAAWMHRIRVTGLTPETSYNYTVNQGIETFTGQLRTSPAETSSVRFIVYADSETEPESSGSSVIWTQPGNPGSTRRYVADQTVGYSENLKVIESRNPDFIGIAGDLVESGGEQRDWDEFWRHNAGDINDIASNIPIFAAPGNHEVYGGPGAFGAYTDAGSIRAQGKFKTYWEAPSNGTSAFDDRYYRVDYGPITYISLDVTNGQPHATGSDTNWLLGNGPGYPDFNPGSIQYQWLEAQLADAQANSHFTFVQLHHVPYSTGPHGFPAGTGTGFDNQSGVPVRTLTPLFAQYGVDAVLSGHDETYQHSVVDGIHFYDIGIGGDGLRGPSSGADSANPSIVTNPFQVFTAHLNAPEVWNGPQLVSGGKHYGHMEINVTFDAASGKWKAQLDPVYVFPLMDTAGNVTGWERRIYNDSTTLTANAAPAPTGVTIFSTDFESGIPAEIKGPGVIQNSEGYNTEAFLQNTSVPQASATVLTLTDLPEHSSISLDFLLAIINSWDGADGASSPDVLNVAVDGKIIFSRTFDNFVLPSQSYIPPAGVLLTPRIGPTIPVSPDGFANLGLDTGIGQEEFWGDAQYAMGNDPTFSLIPHTSSTLTVEWFASGAGYQGGGNESWAIDDLSVTLEGVNGAADMTIFSTDFESGIPAEITGYGFIRGSEGYNTGSFLQNTAVPQSSSTVLTLTNLPQHSSVSLDFLLAMINSWDGVDGGASPDIFNVSIDGRTIFSKAFDNFVLSSQTYLPPDGVLLTPRIGATASFSPNGFANLGLDTGLGQEEFWGDALYAMGNDPTFNLIPHTSSTLTVEWFANGSGYQGGSNESWAIDNLSVTLGGVILAKPSIEVPATNVSQRPTISWPAVAGASIYEVWINNLSTNTTALLRDTVAEPLYVPTMDLGIGRFRVWVRAMAGPEIVSEWSSKKDFNVVTSVSLTSLNPIQLTHRPTLTWNGLPGADHYDIWINDLSSGISQIVRDSNVKLTFFPVPTDLPIGTYRAWARGIAKDNTGAAWSSAMSFSISPAPAVTQGQNATFNQIPVLKWNALPGATHYDIWIDNRSTGKSQVVRNVDLTSTTFTVSTPMPIGNYRAWVRGVGAGSFTSSWSAAIDFRVTGTPMIIRDATSTFDTTPTLAWNAVSGATVYEVYIRNQSTGALYLEQKNISATQFTPASSLPDGPYRWWVRAETSDGLRSLWSAPVDFTVGGRTQLVAPLGNTSDTTPTFTWQRVHGALRYDLWVDKVGGQSQIIRQQTLTGTSFTQTTSLAAGTYRAWIRAIATTGDVSVWSTYVEFRIVGKEDSKNGRDVLSPTLAALPSALLQAVPDSIKVIAPDEQKNQPGTGSIESTHDVAAVQHETADVAEQSRQSFMRHNHAQVDAVMAEFAVWCFTDHVASH